MGVRVTGINTPIVGVNWEYTDPEIQQSTLGIAPNRKIRVFISSICGVEKYDRVRAELKKTIEDTRLADVYTFEGEGSSSLPAGCHYIWSLEDSDICIFLIDNADGINPGVQEEIDTVKKHRIKALYYFCDEAQKEKTALEQSLMGAQFSKSKTVHSFDELSKDSAHALINDIIDVYRYYCAGKIVMKEETDDVQGIDVTAGVRYDEPIIPKTVLNNVDKCRDYILKLVLGYSREREPDKILNTSGLDEWGLQFLSILFEGKSIRNFNTAMYLEELKEQQPNEHFQIIEVRWQAIQAYFLGDVQKCIECLEKALDLAKETCQPTWLIKDILIDLRNQHWVRCTATNEFYDTPAQKELIESEEELYYPILDRIHESLHEKYIDGLYKKKTESPHSVTLGGNLDQCGGMLASSLIISMYNGSLTHLLLIYEKIRDFVFYLCNKYDDWNFRLNLYKLAIFAGKEKEVKGIEASYPEILNKLTADEAVSIMDFCLNHPIKHERLISQLLAFGAVGYFLDDKRFEQHGQAVVREIKTWLDDDNSVNIVGYNIFKCLSGVAHRMSQDTLSEICCRFVERNYSRWYIDMFKFMARGIDLRKMTKESAQSLMEHVNKVLDSENDRKQVDCAPGFLCALRSQSIDLTDSMDKKVAEYFPKYYKRDYKLATTEIEKQDVASLIQEYVERIKKNNKKQGKNGVYYGRGVREAATVRAILLESNNKIDNQTMDALIAAEVETLLVSKEGISTKLDAIALLTCIAIKYPEAYMRNRGMYEKVFEQREEIDVANIILFSSNINIMALKIGLCFLYVAMGKDVYSDILELMPCIQGDIATTLAVVRLIVKHLESTDSAMLPAKVEAIVLQNILQWLSSENLDIRWYATRALLLMTRNPEHQGVINHQIVNLIDSGNVYIKNLIIRSLNKMHGITDATKDYILSKCKHDANFAVRMVCAEV